jgi:hypothetical protein
MPCVSKYLGCSKASSDFEKKDCYVQYSFGLAVFPSIGLVFKKLEK